MTDETDEWGYGLGGLVWIPDVEESYPKPEAPKVLTPLEEQDRVWKLLVQAAKN